MKKLLYMVIFGLVYHFSDAQALKQADAERQCRALMAAPKVTITTSYSALRYDFSKNNRTLTRKQKQVYGGTVGKGHEVHGLATYNLVTDANFQLRKSTTAGGAVCFYPDSVHLNIGIKDPVIYLSSSLKAGTCEYDVAMRHEQTHQLITAEIINYYMPIIQKRFTDAIATQSLISRVYDLDMMIAKETLQKRYQNVLDPLLQEIQNTIRAEQAKLDNTEQYGYEEKICKSKKN